jgi:hypothetical protein
MRSLETSCQGGRQAGLAIKLFEGHHRQPLTTRIAPHDVFQGNKNSCWGQSGKSLSLIPPRDHGPVPRALSPLAFAYRYCPTTAWARLLSIVPRVPRQPAPVRPAYSLQGASVGEDGIKQATEAVEQGRSPIFTTLLHFLYRIIMTCSRPVRYSHLRLWTARTRTRPGLAMTLLPGTIVSPSPRGRFLMTPASVPNLSPQGKQIYNFIGTSVLVNGYTLLTPHQQR